jgi:hypothetical protein
MLNTAMWLIFIGAYVRYLIRTWMKIYVICHTCVHVLVDTIAVRVDVIITSVGVYVIRVAANLVGGTVPAIH